MFTAEDWFDRLRIGEVTLEALPEEKEAYDYTLVFNVVIVVVAVFLAGVIVVKLKGKSEGGDKDEKDEKI
jgi:hypothetical protein